jgi:hypothetical protein
MALLRTGLVATDEYDADADYDDYGAVSLAVRLRVLAMAALGPLITGYAAVAALLALVTAIASRAQFTTVGVLTSAGPGWLAAHQVPIRIEGHELGVLPLLPTIAALVLVARTASGAAQRLELDTPREAAQVVGTIACCHAVFGVVVALVSAGGPVTADPLAAFYYPALLAGIATILGVARHCGLLELALERADEVALRGVRVGLLAVAALLAAGAATLALGLVTSVPTIRELFARNASGFGSGLGMLLLSVGYLPNGIVAGTSFVAGSGFSMGSMSVAPLDFTPGPVPGLPLLAALPESAAAWWPALCAVPIGIGVVVGRLLRDVSDEPMARLRAVAVATGVVALTSVILSGSAGGALGGGPFDPLDLHAASLCAALVAWIGLTGAVVAWFTGTRFELDGGLLDDDLDYEPEDRDEELLEDEEPETDEHGAQAQEDPEPEEPAAGSGNQDLATEIDTPPPTLTVSSTDPPGDHAEPQ